MPNWTRLRYNLTTPMGKDGKRVTGNEEHIALARKAAGESMVLLKNTDFTLPFVKGKKVALFGKGTYDYVKGGGGSGDVNCKYVKPLAEGLKEKEAEGKVLLFPPSLSFYKDYVASSYKEGGVPGLIAESEVPLALIKDASSFTDTAVFTVSRFSGEAWDRSIKGQKIKTNDSWIKAYVEKQNEIFDDGDFYLTQKEKNLFNTLKEYFSSIIVVVNSGSTINLDWAEKEKKVKGILFAYQGGMEGGGAMADILVGDATPSGRLPDTFVNNLEDYYSTSNFHESKDYVNYTDDIYVGYRYFNTIEGEDKKILYPFGYGLSYTSFTYNISNILRDKKDVSLTVEVENTGSFKEKDVIEVYVESPEGLKLDRPKRVLAAFSKTPLLGKGEKATLTLSFPLRDIASFDEEGVIKERHWVLEKGEYSLLISDNSLSFIKKSLTVKEDEVFEHCPTVLSYPLLKERLKRDGSVEILNTKENNTLLSTIPRQDINTLEGIQPKIREGEGYTSHMNLPKAKGIDFERVKNGEMTLSDFISALPTNILVDLIGGQPNKGVANTFGFGNHEDYGIPSVMTADGPAGLRLAVDTGICTTAWPCATALASSWNVELLEEVGRAGGLEVKENGIGLWLTPAVNIHRTPLCGRNFEYYSEDPLLTGKLASSMVRGIESNGVGASVKHFALNNKETNRKESDSRVSERAMREIYLRQFEIIIKEAKPVSVMSSYNLINGIKASENKALLTGILREEWGFEGFVTSDWWTHGEHYLEAAAGNDLKMGNGYPERVEEAMSKGAITREDLENNVRHILSSILRLD